MKFVDNGRLFFAVSLVDRKKERASGFTQKLHEFNIRCRDFRPAIDHHNDRGRLVKRDPRLAKDFRRDEILVFRNDSAGVDNADAPPAPFGVSVQTIARDSRLVTDDGTARADDPVEQRGLAYVGSAHDGERRNARCRGGESAGRVVGRLGQSKLDLSSMWGQPPRLSFVSQDPRGCGSRLFGVTARTAHVGKDTSLHQFFAPGGVLARTHPAYEFRRGQLQMAQAVEQALEEKRHLIVEAGTGTGKTLAYLLPVIRSGKRVIVSTGTKNLQEQLFHKDN